MGPKPTLIMGRRVGTNVPEVVDDIADLSEFEGKMKPHLITIMWHSGDPLSTHFVVRADMVDGWNLEAEFPRCEREEVVQWLSDRAFLMIDLTDPRGMVIYDRQNTGTVYASAKPIGGYSAKVASHVFAP